MKKNFLTVKELARIIGYHPQTIYKYFIKKYGMPYEQKGKHHSIKIYWGAFCEWYKRPKT